MDEGTIILIWIKENGHKLSDVAEKLGYSRSALSDALHKDRITPQLSAALMENFWLRVQPNTTSQRGPGLPRRSPRPSKLDLHTEEITALRKEGVRLADIAMKYETSTSNLHDWLKRNGIAGVGKAKTGRKPKS